MVDTWVHGGPPGAGNGLAEPKDRNRAAYGIGSIGHITPEWELHSNLRLLCGNHNEIKRIREKALKYMVFTGYRALTTRKQATKRKTLSFLYPHESKKLLSGNLLKTKGSVLGWAFRADAPYPPLRHP